MDYKALFNDSVFAFKSEKNVMEEKDLGICANVASVRTPEYSVCSAESFQGCPYTDTGFKMDIRISGERIKAKEWIWLPNAMLRKGSADGFEVESLIAVVPDSRTFVLKVTVRDVLGETRTLPVRLSYRGCPRYETDWRFSIPKPGELNRPERYSSRDNLLTCVTPLGAFAVTSSLAGMKDFHRAYLWENYIELPANGEIVFYFSVSMGEREKAFAEAEAAKGNYEALIEKSFEWFRGETERIHANLPRLTSSCKALDTLYYRSLVTYILCRWENPDLCVSPYFSTGSINGACMCSYLWDYCGGLMLHPIYDTEGNKKALLTYLKNDLASSYAINPVTGGKLGPWYQINQEKIICMVYYHVLFTGEKEFLFERAGDKSVIEWMVYHAYVADDAENEPSLYDYGEGGKDHLELRGKYVYNGIMPDLNARRYMNYMRVYELTRIAGCPDENLTKRAEGIKEKLKSLWNDEAKWYDFINAEGKRDIRYTVQMFKFINSSVIDKKEREGLISHLNENEFLSEYGLHSMSKLDEAYDQDDIDNGGGGICTHFTMQICAQLYEMGYSEKATDILRRVYWWGERLPYMGDSCAANYIANREDTPLQGDISSVSCAQMIFYYIFGIRADFDGNITVCPVKERPANHMKIENARLCGKIFSVDINGDLFSVTCKGETKHAKIGERITL